MKALEQLVEGQELTSEQATQFMEELVAGEMQAAVAGAYLTALRMRGETPLEIASFAKVMREHSVKVRPDVENLVDLCGTGGDGKNTFNISTASMFVAAGAGAYVAKHGNRSITSQCGSADVLEELGVNIELSPKAIAECIEKTGLGFMYAPQHHPAMKNVMPIRRALGFRTVFNVLGPLTNPANAQGQLIGVFNPALTEHIARVCQLLGLKRAVVVNGNPGLDELSTLGHNQVSILRDDEIRTDSVNPRKYGFKPAKIEDVGGGSRQENARHIRDVLEGVRGPRREITLFNAAGALIASGITDEFTQAIEASRQSIDSGTARKKLDELIAYTNSHERD